MAKTANFGTTPYVSTTGVNGPWVKVNDIKAYAGIKRAKAEIEVTTIDQVLKDYIGGMPEGQQWSFDLFLNDSSTEQSTIIDAFDNESKLWFRFRDNRAAVARELVIGFTTLEHEFDTGNIEGAKMLKVGGRISGDFLFRTKTAV